MSIATSLPSLTPAVILRELSKLSVGEMDVVLNKLQVLCAAKKGALPEVEAKLIMGINETLSAKDRAAYRRLSVKRKNEDLSPAEQRELIRLSDVIEVLHARRMTCLAKLAAIRKTSVPELMRGLGLASLASHA